MSTKTSFQKAFPSLTRLALSAGTVGAALLLLSATGFDGAFAQDAKKGADKSAEKNAASTASSADWDPYLKGMTEQILSKWVTPERVGQYKNIKIEIRVRKDGKLANSNLTKSSQIVSVDEACKKAVTKAAPFQPFPAGVKEEFAKFEVNFDKGDIASKRSIVRKIDKNYKPEKEDDDNKQSF